MSRLVCSRASARLFLFASRSIFRTDSTTLQRITHPVRTSATLLLIAALSLACTPTVKVATDEPITINLNVNIKHEILVKVDKELDDIFSEDSDLF